MLNFSLADIKPWIGLPVSRPASLCRPSVVPQVTVPAQINWELYLGPALNQLERVGVEINLNQTGNQVILDIVKSVYIDNLGNNVPIYVVFPDTGFEVACQPNSAAWFPVYTNGKICYVIGDGFTLNDRDSVTTIFLSNLFVPPYISNDLPRTLGLYRSSPEIQRGGTIYNSLYAPAALGDQTVQAVYPLTSPNAVTILSVNVEGGFYYWTNLIVSAVNPSTIGTAVDLEWIISGSISGALYRQKFHVATAADIAHLGLTNQILLSLQPMQLKLSALETWSIQTNAGVSGGQLDVIVNYSYHPQ